MKSILLALAVLSIPAAAIAACSSQGDQAMSCAQGTIWDDATRTCEPVVIG